MTVSDTNMGIEDTVKNMREAHDRAFSDPFFTDPNYMKKESQKFDKSFKKMLYIGIGITLFTAIFYAAIISFGATMAVKQIEEQGGVAKTIGGFIKEVRESAE